MIEYYSKNAEQVAEKYEKLLPEEVHHTWLHFVPAVNSLILDIGAGSGRDAAWLAGQGHEVVAVEPADALREKAKELHPHYDIRWVKDMLPDLEQIGGLELKFDLILVNAVWMHIPLWEREKSFEKMVNLLNPGGRLVITLRYGPAADERKIYPVDNQELHRLADRFGLTVVLDVESRDLFGRSEVFWTTVVLWLSGKDR
ncbi:class I SAM-dependent methyltransferase [Thermodesulfobacteriota bacterium]